ncbi:hypothetical protein [Bacillus sp. T33-2]|uniref:hypothetical protein n=1 Tax=Bacillus sp. T33-2 TaxID=2054168 RepID=UPI000C77312C|nr:hypothetical protein [Bacillus sp. T33-2]PLR89517.1 hypothetical protein CVD19_23590 [Bacillus sp. T33-2]
MTITIRIDYISAAGYMTQGGTFPLRDRRPEQVAYEWWMQIKREGFVEGIVKVIVDGDKDVTEQVKEYEKKVIGHEMNDELPF